MPHPQSTSLSTHPTVPPFASDSIATSWQLSVGGSGDGMENASATEYEYATADDGSEWHSTATMVHDGIDCPTWDDQTQAFLAMGTGTSSTDAFASLDPVDRVYPELYSPPQFSAPYESLMATASEKFTIPPLDLSAFQALPADDMHVEAEEATYEPESYDAGLDELENFTDTSTSYSPPNEPHETSVPSVAETVSTGSTVGEGTITWHPVSIPQHFAPPALSVSGERAPSNVFMSMPPPDMYAPYEPQLAVQHSYFASQPVSVALNHWCGAQAQYPVAQYPVAGPSHIQPQLLQDADYFLPSYPMSAATTPSAAHLSLPPTPAAGASMPPASGPVHKTRTHKSATTCRKTAGTAPTGYHRPKHVRCELIGTLSKEECTLHKNAAEAAHYRRTPTLKCAWNGCNAIIENRALLMHLQSVHGTAQKVLPMVGCLWGGCTASVGGSALKKHVRSHLKLKLICTGCGGQFARRDALGRHLEGAKKKKEDQ
ncbi:hypothetical protein C8R47DRAFT_111950 [Mycena vitilis]|nr:hypothetical protein C8R47DRAFT_111950 [Mycena vitilis]